MSKTFTLKKIASPKKSEQIKNQFNEIDSMENEMDPGKNVIANILNYSKALSIRKSKNIEFIENVLN